MEYQYRSIRRGDFDSKSAGIGEYEQCVHALRHLALITQDEPCVLLKCEWW